LASGAMTLSRRTPTLQAAFENWSSSFVRTICSIRALY
jgi:hypothetical protein